MGLGEDGWCFKKEQFYGRFFSWLADDRNDDDESTGLVIERLRVQILAEEISSPELTLCADSYSVSSTPVLL